MLSFELAHYESPPTIVVQKSQDKKPYALGVCATVEFNEGKPLTGAGTIRPDYDARIYFQKFQKKNIELPKYKLIQLNSAPQYGTISPYVFPGDGIDSWRYIPNVGYLGADKAEFIVETEGGPVRVFYYFKVTKLNLDSGANVKKLCKEQEWKISTNSTEINTNLN